MKGQAVTELRRYNIVPMIVGKPTNHEYEQSGVGQIVFADNALTVIRELGEVIRELGERAGETDGRADKALEIVAGLKAQLAAMKQQDDRVEALVAEACRFYHADGTFETLASPAEVTQRRIECAKQIEALSAPTSETENFHFENDEVLAAVANTQYAKDAIARRLVGMTVDQKWSLYRAVVKLAMAARKGAASE